MKKLNKKVFLTLGSIATITTPIIAVVSCGKERLLVDQTKDDQEIFQKTHKQTQESDKNTTSNPKDTLNQLIDLIKGFTGDKFPKEFSTSEGKDKLETYIINLFKHGISGISSDQLNDILNQFKVSDKVKIIVSSLVEKDGKVDDTIVNALFNNGLDSLADSPVLANIIKTVKGLLPKSVSSIITEDLMNKLLNKGWKDANALIADLTPILKPILDDKIPSIAKIFVSSESLIKAVANDLFKSMSSLLSHGLLHITKDDLKQIIAWNGNIKTGINSFVLGIAKGFLPSYINLDGSSIKVLQTIFGYLDKDKFDHNPAGWNLVGRIQKIWNQLKILSKNGKLDTILDGIATVVTGGINNITDEQVKEVTNLVMYAANYDIKVDNTDLNIYQTALKKMFTGKFVDGKNTKPVTKPVDVSLIDKATYIGEAFDIAKKIKAYGQKTSYKDADEVTIKIAKKPDFDKIALAPGEKDPAITYKNTLINFFHEMYADKAKTKNKNVDISKINKATTIKELSKAAKAIWDKLAPDEGWFSVNRKDYDYYDAKGNKHTEIKLPLAPKNNSYFEKTTNKYISDLVNQFKDKFSDNKNEHGIDISTIKNAKTIDQAKASAQTIINNNNKIYGLVTSYQDGKRLSFTKEMKKIIKDHPTKIKTGSEPKPLSNEMLKAAISNNASKGYKVVAPIHHLTKEVSDFLLHGLTNMKHPKTLSTTLINLIGVVLPLLNIDIPMLNKASLNMLIKPILDNLIDSIKTDIK